MRAGERPAREARTSTAGFRYDTDLIKSDKERLLAEYLGRPGKVSGSRLVWDCPKCAKPKLSLFRTNGAVGCLNAGCDVEGETDVIGLIASLEGLQTRGEEFRRVCALCYRLLSIPDPTAPATGGGRPGGGPASTNGKPPDRGRAAASDGGRGDEDRGADPETFTPAAPEVVDAVLSRLLQLCPLEERDVRFLASRGVAEATARVGRFGSITAPKARHAVAVLDQEFSREELRGVPGFREELTGGGRLGFTLFADFLLIPYFDRAGRVVTLEGRVVGEAPKWAGKYTSLRNGGNHLYVFPGFEVEDLVAICEGPMGAIVAAQEGLPVGAIQGVKRYTKAGGDAPLPELAGTNFRGRTVLYVPDLDVKPDARADVEKHAARACEFLVGRQNGRGFIATVPQNETGARSRSAGAKDLDAWILSVPEAGPLGVLHGLRSRAWPPEEWPGLPDPDGRAPDRPPAPSAQLSPVPEPGRAEPVEDVPDPAGTEAESAAEAAEEEGPEAGGADEEEPSADADDAQVKPADEEDPGGAEAGEDDAVLDAYDRWHAVLEGYPGSAALAARPEPYRPRDVASPVPGAFFADEAECEWACLAGLLAAVVLWYYVGASDGWLAGGVAFLPSLPHPLPMLYGVPFALLFGALVGVLWLLRTRSKRLAARRHMLGEDRR